MSICKNCYYRTGDVCRLNCTDDINLLDDCNSHETRDEYYGNVHLTEDKEFKRTRGV